MCMFLLQINSIKNSLEIDNFLCIEHLVGWLVRTNTINDKGLYRTATIEYKMWHVSYTISRKHFGDNEQQFYSGIDAFFAYLERSNDSSCATNIQTRIEPKQPHYMR